MDINALRQQVAAHITDRPVVLIGADLDRFAQHLHELRSMHAQKVLIVTSGVGAGPLPDLSGFNVEFVDIPTLDGEAHAETGWREVMRQPPASLARALDAFDPHHEAAIIPWRFRTDQRIGDRAFYGPRLASAVALEDKTVIGSFLRELRIPEPPGAVSVAATAGDLLGAARRLDRGDGTVWSGDASQATNSGAKYVRWVRTAEEATDAIAFFGRHCHQVRIAPFLEGIPCGMHAFVHRSGVAVFRPVELLIMRSASGSGFVDAGFATTFDPSPEDAAAYRDLVARIGNGLWKSIGYEGALSVDAILTRDGWMVHDINPRQGGGLIYVQTALPDLPIHLLHHVAAAGDLRDFDAPAFGALVRDAADRQRVVAAAYAVPSGPLQSSSMMLEPVPGQLVRASYRPRVSGGGKVHVTIAPNPGPPVAPLVARVATRVQARLGVGVELAAARQVRAGRAPALAGGVPIEAQ